MRSILLLAILAAAGCATVEVDGFRIHEGNYHDELAAVTQRASFDFDCPAAKLQTKVVGITAGVPNIVSQFGVTGCGHRGTYVRTMSGWVLNADNGNPPEKAASR